LYTFMYTSLTHTFCSIFKTLCHTQLLKIILDRIGKPVYINDTNPVTKASTVMEMRKHIRFT